MPPTIIGVISPLPVTLQVIGAVAGLDHLLVGNGGHKGAKGEAGLAGVSFAAGRVSLDGQLHRIGPQVDLGPARPFVAGGNLDVVPGIADDDAV